MPFIIVWTIFAYTTLSLGFGASTEELDYKAVIERYDEFKGNAMWRADVAGAYRTRWGLQVDQSCLEHLPADNNTKNILENWVNDAVQSVVSNCGETYPELEDYIKQWVTQLRRSVIICDPENHHDYGAYASSAWFKTTVQGKKIETRNYFKRTKPLSPLAKNYEATYVFNPSWLLEISLLIHEVFHSTSANSHKQHNLSDMKDKKIETMVRQEDRVHALEELCSHNPSEAKKRIITQLLNPDILSCVQTFTRKIRHSQEFYSKPLPVKDAIRFCQTLESQKNCFLHEGASERIKLENEINKILEDYRRETLPYMAQWEGHIPYKAQALFPPMIQEKIKLLHKESERDPCIQKYLHFHQDTQDITALCDGKFNFKQFGGTQIRMYSPISGCFFQNFVHLAQEKKEECPHAQLIEEVLDHFGALQIQLAYLTDSTIASRSLGGPFPISLSWGALAERDVSLAEMDKRKLLSQDLIEKMKKLPEYFGKLQKLYDIRSCIQSVSAAKQLMHFNKTPSQPSCLGSDVTSSIGTGK